MDKIFSIYESPLSDETKVLRRNSLLSSGLCLFIAMTGELPSQFSLLGVSFSANQQELIGWFILAVAFYFFSSFYFNGICRGGKVGSSYLPICRNKKNSS